MHPSQIPSCGRWQSTSLKVSDPKDGDIITVLNELDESEMLEIPNIDPEKVARYGKIFLKLIRDAHRSYEAMMQQHEDRPRDPNHLNVVEISSDDEYGDGGDLDDLDADEDSQEESRQSRYFLPSADPEVDAFNARSAYLMTFLDCLANQE